DRVRLRRAARAVAARRRPAAGQLVRLDHEDLPAQARLHGGAQGQGLNTEHRHMYEIWLALNIVYELALANASLVLAYLLGLLALMLVGPSARGAAWRRALPITIPVGLAVAIAACLLLPGRSKSSFGEMRYW